MFGRKAAICRVPSRADDDHRLQFLRQPVERPHLDTLANTLRGDERADRWPATGLALATSGVIQPAGFRTVQRDWQMSGQDIARLDQQISKNVDEIRKQLERYRSAGLSLFATSSFQTHSLPLLHVLSGWDCSLPIYFINTGYHFPETLAFRDQVARRLRLHVVDLCPMTPKNLQRDQRGLLYYASDPDQCCFMNKVQPLEPILSQKGVWINGIRAEQSANRRAMAVEEHTRQGALRYHPMLDWTEKMVLRYLNLYDLPSHPLDSAGYSSVGCEPCTRRVVGDGTRSGRWFGLNKTECGLHVDLVVTK